MHKVVHHLHELVHYIHHKPINQQNTEKMGITQVKKKCRFMVYGLTSSP
jgi:hypothetical protein